MERNKICFYARAAQCKLYAQLGRVLESKYDVCYITQNPKEKQTVASAGCDGNIYVLTEYLKRNWDNKDILNRYSSLNEIEDKYDIDSIWSLFYADRFLIHYDYQSSIKFIKLHVAFFEDLINIEKCDFLFNESIAIFSSYIFYKIGIKLNCQYRGFAVPTNHANTKFYFTHGLYNMNPRLDIFYNNPEKLSNEEKENAKKLINDVVKTKYRPEYQAAKQLPRFEINFIPQLIKYVYRRLIHTPDVIDYEAYVKWKYSGLYRIRNFIKYHFYHKKYFQNPETNQKYLLFPLHFQPEGTTLVCAPQYEKQLFAIDNIAKNLPGEYVLYIKEHYTNIGHRDKGFYKNLQKYPNVKIISPLADSHDLIANSEGVIVLTSTVGWEAMLHKKPVFMLGHFMYDTFRFINKIDDISKLSEIIKKKTRFEFGEDYVEELIIYVASFLKSLRNGTYILRRSDKLLAKENIDNLLNSLDQEINDFNYDKN